MADVIQVVIDKLEKTVKRWGYTDFSHCYDEETEEIIQIEGEFVFDPPVSPETPWYHDTKTNTVTVTLQ